MSKDEIMKQYYPHTNSCPHDGRPCLNKECKLWIEDRVCWDIEFGSLVSTIFEFERHEYKYYHLQDFNYPNLSLHVDLWADDKKNFSEIPKMVISIGLSSHRLAKRLKEKFKLTGWEIEGQCEDGGDDHALVMTSQASHIEKHEIIKLLGDIKNLIPKLILEEKNINTCQMCNTHCESLTDHDNYSICYRCEQRIISENLPKYFQK